MSQVHFRDTDHSLADVVHSTLARSPYFAGGNVRVELDDDNVVLRGIVRTYYQKQIAQESVRCIEGVGQIVNELEVATPSR